MHRARLDAAIAAVALILMAALPLGLLVTIFGVMRVFGAESPDLATVAAKITGGVAMALRATVIGQMVGFIGLLVLLYVLLGRDYRARWFFRSGRWMLIAWLPVLGCGTVLGLVLLSYFRRHRSEFCTSERTPPPAVRP